MQNGLPENNSPRTGLTARLDRAAGNMNAFLVVLAIGLATLDLTCLWAFKMRDALPGMALATTSSAAPVSAANKPAHVQAAATSPSAPKNGW